MVDMSGKSKTESAWLWMCGKLEFDIPTLRKDLGMGANHAHQLVNRLLSTGHVNIAVQGASRTASRYQVCIPQEKLPDEIDGRKAGRWAKKRATKKTSRQKMWNTMKISRTFGLIELAMTSNTATNSASIYTRSLVKAGYLKVLVAAVPHKGIASKYLLTRDTGRHAPIVRRNGCWDQNQQRLYPFLVEEGEHGNVA
ncbi:hypothetical protein [Aeromonas veronii]|uniref:hypothetical protein n=1 Tax=Aeromonas veronii TaxID=654 RepID=UPI000F8F0DBF|nr:hypothetical protein [Aeromonas veronii]MDX7878611.1 hypothetical protein [Aeromonas veronii]RUR54770.1 hypothetical protein ELS78_16150 [Aeromonas veronii]UBR44012.1 hypothetical protein LAG74_12915 [Aeromonas veronii]UDN24431.1 hypothetical protein LEO77_07930 [Aeromonas veronii]